MGWAFLIQIVIAVVVAVIQNAMRPKPKQQKPAAAQDMDAPTADAGRPIQVPFGTLTITGLNVLHYDSKEVMEYKVSV